MSKPTFFEDNAIPWSPRLRQQHGRRVECLPFGVTPFALQDAARQLSYQRAVVDDDFKIDPTSITTRFVSILAFVSV